MFKKQLLVFALVTRAAFGNDVPTLIEDLKGYESLYDNIDMHIEYRYDYLRGHATRAEVSKPGSFVVFSDTVYRSHFVRQGDKFRVDRAGHANGSNGAPYTLDRVRAYDGTRTLLFEQNAYGNIADFALEDENCLRPHMLLLQFMKFGVPLSTYLSGTDAMLAHPQSHFDPSFTIEAALVGSEDVDGIDCSVIQVNTIIQGSAHDGWKLWLGKSRNLIPVRLEGYTYRVSMNEPVGIGVVEEWLEIDKGIWMPKKVSYTAYNKETLREANTRTVQWKSQITAESVSLNPEYPDDFFSDVKFPDGIPVSVLNAEKAVESSLVNGSPHSPASSTRKTRWLWIVCVNVAVIGGLALATYRRRRKILTT